MNIVCINGNIRTMDGKRTVAEAIAMKDGLIAYIGTNEGVTAFIEQADRVIDLEGKTMLPGFFDGHMHLASYGYSKSMAYLDDCGSIESLIDTMKAHIEARESALDTWVEGRGWNETYYPEGRMPNRHDLDLVSEDHMIAIGRSCSYICVVNTKTLKELGYYDNPPVAVVGNVEVGEDGRPTGVFVGEATHLIYSRIPTLGVEGTKEAVLAACNEYVTSGITSVDTDDFELTRAGTFREILQAYFELDEEGKLPIRVRQMLYLPTQELLEDFISLGHKSGDGSPFFRIGSFKMISDGSLGTRQAALFEPYADDAEEMGEINQSQQVLSELMRIAFEADLDLVGDGMGDRGIYMLLKAYEPLVRENPDKDLRFCIDHSQITTEGLIEEYKRLGVVGGCELVFVSSDIDIVEERIGKHRASLSYNWKRFYDEGVIVTAGSDSPVEHFDPIEGIHAAVNRLNWDGAPEGGWLPEQKLSVDEAVSAFTIGSAYAAREEDVKGTLEVGKYADAVVLSEDIFTIAPTRIKEAKAVMTFVDGKVAYEA